MSHNVHIFWDNSNIFIPAQYVATQRDGVLRAKGIRIHFDNLLSLAQAGRNVGTGICVGSVPPDLRKLWDRLGAVGVKVELFERGAGSGTEQGVDQCLQVHMLRAIADVMPPAVAVLLTGDGKGYEDGAGYHADLERMWKAGWGIEVVSWQASCNKTLQQWAQQVGIFVPLDDYYEFVTFIEGGRRAIPPSFKHRGFAVPRTI